MGTRERSIRILTPDDNHSFQETGREEVHTIEAYEKRVHGENIEVPTRQFSTNAYTERRTYGRDENGEVVVKIETNPSDPVRPVSPVRPFGSTEQLLRPLPNLETTPLHIPRVDTRNSNRNATLSPVSIQWQDQPSPRSVGSNHQSPRSGRSSGFGSSPHSVDSLSQQPIAANVPMRKITRKSRLVSIYDGRPVSPYVERVHFEVADNGAGNDPFASTYQDQWAYKNDGVVLNAPRPSDSPRERYIPIQHDNRSRHEHHNWQSTSNGRNHEEQGAIVTENPLFYGY
ncbi:hypothetical protein M3Y94_00790500 [Aphelenchoides besseyi]|nr:hypothetical protein M3Y94_00790500 [Aphelenchoides besseyi]KAI6232444.1 hypothetical protein M3Y95_00486500 [Aphelenchoides besseyi]